MSENSNNFLLSFLKLKTQIRNLIISNIIISIRDMNTGKELWRCSDDRCLDKRFKNIHVIQDFEVEDFLLELLPLLNKTNKFFPVESQLVKGKRKK